MDLLLQDLSHALRNLRRSPGFTLAAVLMLGVGLGASTALFSVVEAVLLRPLPFPAPERLVRLWQVGEEGRRMNVSGPNFEDVKAQSRSFEALARMSPAIPVSVSGPAEPVRTVAVSVSRDFFAVLGVQPAQGRAFLPEEQQEGGAPAVVVSHGFWRRHLGAPADLTGRTLRLEGRVYSVVGVMPEGRGHPAGVELWTPAELSRGPGSRTAHNWEVLGRLGAGVSLEAARRELSALARTLKAQHGDGTWMVDAALVPLHEHLVGPVRPALLTLLGAAALLLVVAGANVTNLLLARAAVRQRELAVRVALGAGRAQLVRGFVCEGLLLALTGAGVGGLLALAGVDALHTLAPEGLPRLEGVGVDGTALAFALGLAVLLALALGVGTALRATGRDLAGTLASGLRPSGGPGGGQRVRRALVVAQMALALVLLVGTGLLVRSLVRLLSTEPGYRGGELVVLSVSLPFQVGADELTRRVQLFDALQERLRVLPGVSAVGGANVFPFDDTGGGNGQFLVVHRPDEVRGFDDFQRLSREKERVGQAEFRVASEGYFRTLGIPLLRGRLFEGTDGPDAPHVAVISESLARAQWPGEEPLGKLIQFGNMDGDLHAFTVVGVVGDIREESLEAAPRPTLYAHVRQRPRQAALFHVALRADGAPTGALVAAARTVLRELAPELPPRVRTLEGMRTGSLAARRFSLLLLAVFGGAALLLAALGLAGVVAFSVAQRTREFGVRMALGARPGDVLRLVLRQAGTMALLGVGVGWALALALARVARSLVSGVSSTDPLAFTVVTVLLGAVALLAAWVPARRAARVDPQVALRSE
jgi:putative ABC transport system permease protein